jgi:hydroxymethylpyrimidine pyrophosphatase-like HAD family hydrolase
MSNDVKVLVFDLDGTLARTASLTQGRRTPHDILKFAKPSFPRFPLAFNEPLPRYISDIIKYGIPVIVITRAPLAYASSLLQLLGIDFSYCVPSSLTSPSEKIRQIAQNHKVLVGDVLYLGDTEEDRAEAELAGVHFEFPYWITKDTEKMQLMKENSRFFKLALAAEAFDFENIESAREEDRSQLLRAIREKEVQLNLSTFNIEYRYDNSLFEIQLFNAPFIEESKIVPPINHCVFTRFEYETSSELREIMLSIIRGLTNLPRIRADSKNLSKSFYDNYLINSFSPYMYSIVGEKYWRECKDFKSKYVGSGPETQLHLIELIVLLMSACIESDEILIPVPSSSYSRDKPGEISTRIVHRIAELNKINIMLALVKTGEKKFVLAEGDFAPDSKYVLIDDQLTTGETLESCLRLLPEFVQNNLKILTWTYSPGRGWYSELRH